MKALLAACAIAATIFAAIVPSDAAVVGVHVGPVGVGIGHWHHHGHWYHHRRWYHHGWRYY